MNWKGLEGLVLLLSLTLVLPYSAVYSAVKKSTQQNKASNTEKFSSKGHPSPLKPSEWYENHESNQQNPTTEPKEAPLVRLKRIKREVEKKSSFGHDAIVDKVKSPSHLDHEVLSLHDKSSRPALTAADRRKSWSHSGGNRDRDSKASRVHVEMLRKKEQSGRVNPYRVKGHTNAVPARKGNEIFEPIQIGIQHHTTGTGSYIQHRNEQNRLEKAAEGALRQRTHSKKTKHQKNRGEFVLKGNPGSSYQTVSHSRPMASVEKAFEGQTNRYHDGRGGGVRERDHVLIKGQGASESKHRSRRGQSTKTVAAVANGEAHGQKVRAELEQIKRMQRDLMREISHLEHMKKKKKKLQRRSASSASHQIHRKPAEKSKRK